MNLRDKIKLILAGGLAACALFAGSFPAAAQAQEDPAPPAVSQEEPAAAQEEPAQEEAATAEEAEEAEEPEAEEPGGGGFSFRIDPLVVGVLETDVDTNSSKFEEYRDLDSGFYLGLGLHGESGDRERTLDFEAQNVRRDDARYTLDYALAGRYRFVLDYNKIPHRFGNGGRILWNQTRPGVYEIADPVQRQLQDAVAQQFNTNRTGLTFPFLNGLLDPYISTARQIDLSLQRDRTLARFDLGKMGGFGWGIEYFHENRKGNRPFGSSFGFNNVTELPEPIDYDTTHAEVAGEWSGERGALRAGYRYSKFENNVGVMIWDNPFRITDSTDPSAYLGPSSSSINGSSRGFADLAPDNQANLVFLDGKTRFGGWWAHGSASYNQMSQDDPLLPYTLNTAIVGIDPATGATFDPTNVANLPVRRADTEVDVLSLNADTGTRFADALELIFRYRYYDYDNQSARVEFPGYVRYHSVWEEIPRVTVPYAYSRQDVGAELIWDVFKASRLGLEYRLRSWERDYREVESSDEDILSLSFDTQPVAWFSLRASYDLGDRNIDGYEPEAAHASFLEPTEPSNNPLLRKFAQAALEYDQINLDTDFFLSEAWNLTLGVSSRDEDYNESVLGLLDDDIVQYNAEISYTPGENASFYLFGHRADREVFQRSRQSGATPSTREIDDWEVTLDEVTDTWGVGMTAKLSDRWSTDLSGRWSNADGFADFTAFPGGLPLSGTPRTEATDFDNYEDIELLALLARFDYKINEAMSAGFWYRFEDYTIDSFILQGLRNYLPGALLLNPNNGDYQANLFALELRLSF